MSIDSKQWFAYVHLQEVDNNLKNIKNIYYVFIGEIQTFFHLNERFKFHSKMSAANAFS